MTILTEQVAWELDEVVADIFKAMTDVSCVPAAVVTGPMAAVCAHIDFHGQLRGWCRLSMEERDAAACALALLGSEVEQKELHADSVGELCNMIAGGWKSLQPPPPGCAAMSPPLVCAPGEREADVNFLRLLRQYVFAQNSFEVEIALHADDATALMLVDGVRRIS